MPVVYKIIFPDGCFYIGATKCLDSRLHGHWASRTYVSDKIKESFKNYNRLDRATIIIHYGEDYIEVEKQAIFHERNNIALINKQIINPNKEPMEDTEYSLMIDKIKGTICFGSSTNGDIKKSAKCIFVRSRRAAHVDPYSKEGKKQIRRELSYKTPIELLEFLYAHIIKEEAKWNV